MSSPAPFASKRAAYAVCVSVCGRGCVTANIGHTSALKHRHAQRRRSPQALERLAGSWRERTKRGRKNKELKTEREEGERCLRQPHRTSKHNYSALHMDGSKKSRCLLPPIKRPSAAPSKTERLQIFTEHEKNRLKRM